MGIAVERVNWFSTYRVHHRVADHFRRGRAFLLGDAAHIHSPVGGQGMNTGIGDAVNLAWKLADVLGARAGASLLDSYEPERIAFARRLVATTDRAFTIVTSRGPLARRIRIGLVPRVVPILTSLQRGAPSDVPHDLADPGQLSRQPAERGPRGARARRRSAAVGAGRRSTTSRRWRRWTGRSTSTASRRPDIAAMCRARRLLLNVFPWRTEMGRTGLVRNAVYLVRPDGYVALADPGEAGTLQTYLDTRGLRYGAPDSVREYR